MKIFFQPQDHKDGCASACIAMLLDKPYHEVYIDIHEEYQQTKTEEEEYDYLSTYLKEHGLNPHNDFSEDIDEGLFMVAVPNVVTHTWHGVLLSIYKGQAHFIDPKMLNGASIVGFDDGMYQPEFVRPILKIEWDDYKNLHGEKLND